MRFQVDVDAVGLNIADLDVRGEHDLEPEPDADCDRPRYQQLNTPALLRLLPAPAARLCTFSARNGQSLKLVQFRSGILQRTRLTSVLACRALLSEFIDGARVTGFAGCIGGPWNELDRTDINLVLFEVRAADKRLALIH